MEKIEFRLKQLMLIFLAMWVATACDFEDEPDEVRLPTLTVNAGQDRAGLVGESISLDGSATIDTDNNPITYSWSFTSRPEGSSAVLNDADTPTPNFNPDAAGSYVARLVASTEFEEDEDEVLIVVEDDSGTELIENNINQATTWSKRVEQAGRADYRIMNNISVNAPLTIEAGVIIELAEEVSVQISSDGRLNAIGEEDNRIVFTGVQKEKGYWGEIFFLNSVSNQNRMEYVTFEYGGGGTTSSGEAHALVFLESQYSSGGSTASFVNCIFKESEGFGLGTAISANTDLIDFSGNEFINNTKEAITTSLRIARKIDATTSFTNNGLDGMYLRGNTLSEPAEIIGVDYILADNVTLSSRLKINEGAHFTVKEAVNVTIQTDGVLEAIGSETNPIVFEGEQNIAGYWGGIWFTNARSVDNRLSHVHVSDGGNREEDGVRYNVSVGGQYSNDYSEVKIDNCTFSNSSGFGLMTRRASSKLHDFSSNSFSSNASGAIRLFSIDHLRYIDGDTDLGTTNNFVRIDGGVTESDGTWSKLKDDAYYVMNGADLRVESKITVEAGAQFRFNENTKLSVRNDNSSFTAVGTTGNEIVFTSNRSDNTVFWDGIFFNNSNSVDNKMEHCIVENAGRNNITSRHLKANISIGGQYSNDVSTLQLLNCTIRNSGGFGVSVRSDSNLNDNAETSNTFENNTDLDIDRDR